MALRRNSRYRLLEHALITSLIALVCFIASQASIKTSAITPSQDTPLTARSVALIPRGTILPVRLNHGFSSKSAQAGQLISGRVMQDVPLPGGGKLPAGAKMSGTIVTVSRAATGSGKPSAGRVSFSFDQIELHRRPTPIAVNLRALASFVEVRFAQTPETSPGFGTPYPWVTTELIGGDVKYGVGGPVTDSGSRSVGVGTRDGVLVHVRAPAGGPCRGELDDEERLQALWVFSSDACGVYGMEGVKIEHAGRTAPVGQIILASDAGDVNVRAGAALLLRVL